jgi:ABC-type multidrug transport system ATPase subunit
MSDFVIEISALQKSFKGNLALDGLDLRVPRGSIFGFLGKNGAGKTTTMKLLVGLIRPDSGVVRVWGLDASDPVASIQIRSRMGFVTEDKELYPYMTVEQIIRFTRSFFPKWSIELERRYLEVFELPVKRKIPALSKGMRSKLTLLLAACRGAELLILDEPTEGLDPAATEDLLRELVMISSTQGTTIFFSSHQLAEVDQIADHVAIIDRGRVVVEGSLDDMKARYERLQVVFESDSALPVRWADGAESVRREGRMISILASHNVEGILEQARSIPGASVERFPVTLKDIFLEHVRRN